MATFLTVYILEAHAIDEWPVGDGYGKLKGFKQPQTIEERLRIAKEFVGDFTYDVPMVADSMLNLFDSHFACWPVRYYILWKGRVYYKAQPNAEEYTYSVDELRESLAVATNRPQLGVESDTHDNDTIDSSPCSNGNCTTGTCDSPSSVSCTTSGECST